MIYDDSGILRSFFSSSLLSGLLFYFILFVSPLIFSVRFATLIFADETPDRRFDVVVHFARFINLYIRKKRTVELEETSTIPG